MYSFITQLTQSEQKGVWHDLVTVEIIHDLKKDTIMKLILRRQKIYCTLLVYRLFMVVWPWFFIIIFFFYKKKSNLVNLQIIFLMFYTRGYCNKNHSFNLHYIATGNPFTCNNVPVMLFQRSTMNFFILVLFWVFLEGGGGYFIPYHHKWARNLIKGNFL